VWGDDSGLLQSGTERPSVEAQFDGVNVQGIEFFVDTSIDGPLHWRVSLRRFPRRRVRVQMRSGYGWSDAVSAAVRDALPLDLP
jgi:hypothetical protein